jgi:hypothetical protein
MAEKGNYYEMAFKAWMCGQNTSIYLKMAEEAANDTNLRDEERLRASQDVVKIETLQGMLPLGGTACSGYGTVPGSTVRR